MGIYVEQEVYDLNNHIQSSKRSLRFATGIKEIIRSKWKIVLFVLYAVLVVIAWSKRSYIPTPKDMPFFLDIIYQATGI